MTYEPSLSFSKDVAIATKGDSFMRDIYILDHVANGERRVKEGSLKILNIKQVLRCSILEDLDDVDDTKHVIMRKFTKKSYILSFHL